MNSGMPSSCSTSAHPCWRLIVRSLEKKSAESIATAKAFQQESGLSINIAVDGGNADNALALGEAGADTLIIRTALFGTADMKGKVAQIRGRSRVT